jgi:hypothetical protein
MGNCQVKKGIFVLSECGEQASAKCDGCGVFICGKHGKQDGPKIVCPECYAKTHENDFKKQGKNKIYQSWEDGSFSNYSLWYYTTRHSFFTSSHYHPFDHHDYNSFNNTKQTDFQDDKDTGKIFDS